MHNTYFYGEKVAKISAQLHQNPAHRLRIEHALKLDKSNPESLWGLCADAARVFDTIEDLASDLNVNWSEIFHGYSIDVLSILLSGEKPNMADLICLASQNIDGAR